jgi:uncharacterized spore protein YtfJ
MARPEQVEAEVSRGVQGADFVPRLAERVGLTVRASAVFGDPVERDGVTVVPVARASWGFGGGRGGEPPSEGVGGGGGGVVSPIGFIEVRGGEAKFVRIRDPRPVAAALTTAAAILGFALRRRR